MAAKSFYFLAAGRAKKRLKDEGGKGGTLRVKTDTRERLGQGRDGERLWAVVKVRARCGGAGSSDMESVGIDWCGVKREVGGKWLVVSG